MNPDRLTDPTATARSIRLVTTAVASSQGLDATPHAIAHQPDGTVLVGVGEGPDRWSLAEAARRLPAGDYILAEAAADPDGLAVGWLLGGYSFDRYRSDPAPAPAARLVWPQGADRGRVLREAAAIALVRDLINTPANDMGPSQLAQAAEAVAAAHGASCEVLAGDALLAANYPTIHAVGRASPREPRLIDLRWGDPAAPRMTIVGKGVCFDTGGVNVKGAAAMLRMKKDMGGAAHALALGQMVMDARLPVRLRVLIPAVDNAISGDAMRPLDVVRTRKGLTVEIGHTDAEGRLILSDALAEAASEDPDLLLDFATLTSAARVALGPTLAALFCNDELLAADIATAAAATDDPVWRMPLWSPYAGDLRGKTADLASVSGNDFAGAIYAALFLQRFVEPTPRWAHFDIFAWNLAGRPGRPEGGDAQTLRTAFACLEARYGS